MIETTKETFLPKTGIQKCSFLQDTGYVRGVKGHAAWNVTNWYEIYLKYVMTKVSVVDKDRWQCQDSSALFLIITIVRGLYLLYKNF